MEKENAMSIQSLLSNLKKVKKTGNGKWMACCPSHQDKTASLTITESNDGRILLNCFAGCDTYSILRNVGLDWEDVMPDNVIDHRIKPEKQVIYATDALRLIRFETQVVLVIAYDMKKGKIDSEMVDRLEKAMQLINKASDIANV